ncbi:MAG: sensor histidine kinase, partial [Chitinophagaceae bacterium]
MNEPQYDTRLFEELYDVQPQAIIWSRPVFGDDGTTIVDFEFTYCNDEGLKYMNMTRAEQAGMRLSTTAALTTDLRQKVLKQMVEVYHTGKKSETNIYNPALNKHARVLRVRLRDGVLTVVHDRTEEYRIIKQLEEQSWQLQKQKTLLDKLLQHSPAGISITEVIRNEEGKIVDGRTTLGNDLGFEYTGIPREISLNKTIREVAPEMLESELYQMVLNTLNTGKPFHTQYFFEPTGRWLELSVAKMDNDHLINVFMDVTSTKEAQLRQQKLLDELQRSNANLEEFAYAASHDLQEPLRKIYTFSDRLKHDLQAQLNGSQQMMFGRIESATQRMRSLIDDLLSYSQVSARPDAFTKVSLNEIVQQVLTDLESLIADTEATIQTDNLPMLNGDERQLRQMFQNLIGNAVKYRKPGVPPQI